MTWTCHLRVREEVGIKSGLTQDKSNCVRWAQIANGDGARTRGTAVIRASRRFRQILGQYLDFARLTFWHHFGAHRSGSPTAIDHGEAPSRACHE